MAVFSARVRWPRNYLPLRWSLPPPCPSVRSSTAPRRSLTHRLPPRKREEEVLGRGERSHHTQSASCRVRDSVCSSRQRPSAVFRQSRQHFSSRFDPRASPHPGEPHSPPRPHPHQTVSSLPHVLPRTPTVAPDLTRYTVNNSWPYVMRITWITEI